MEIREEARYNSDIRSVLQIRRIFKIWRNIKLKEEKEMPSLGIKAVIAMDSFKGCLSSIEAGAAVAEGIRHADAQTEICVRPLADGGEGTVDALVRGMNGTMHSVAVTGPLGAPVDCKYGIIPPAEGMPGEVQTAVIEMSGAAGLALLSEKERNPLYTTTYGVGEVILDAVRKGCRRFIVGIGGSSTNDGGIGMLQALGYSFTDSQGRQVPFGAKGLEHLAAITDKHVVAELADCEFRVACDVTNVLCGENGCSAVYGPQKGADAVMVRQMDEWLSRYAALVKEKYPKADACQAGTGAAGGLGFAFLAFTNAVLESGTKIVLEETGLEEAVRDADVVITGEGRLDGQTAMGKAPAGVAALAKKYKIPVIALAGSVTADAVLCNQKGIDAFFPILQNVVTLEEAMEPETAKANLAAAAGQVFRLMKIWKQISFNGRKTGMDIEIIPAYGHPQEVGALFSEYTEFLIEGDSSFREYLAIQHYDKELEHPEIKYGLPYGRLYLAYCRGELAGCIGLKKVDNENCEMKRLYVRPGFRGKRIGNRLVEKIIGDAREIGYAHMLLDTLPFLESAVHLYRNYGFYEIPCYNNSPMEASVYMRLDL